MSEYEEEEQEVEEEEKKEEEIEEEMEEEEYEEEEEEEEKYEEEERIYIKLLVATETYEKTTIRCHHLTGSKKCNKYKLLKAPIETMYQEFTLDSDDGCINIEIYCRSIQTLTIQYISAKGSLPKEIDLLSF